MIVVTVMWRVEHICRTDLVPHFAAKSIAFRHMKKKPGSNGNYAIGWKFQSCKKSKIIWYSKNEFVFYDILSYMVLAS